MSDIRLFLFVGGPANGRRVPIEVDRRFYRIYQHDPDPARNGRRCIVRHPDSGWTYDVHAYERVRLTEQIEVFLWSKIRIQGVEDVLAAIVDNYSPWPELPNAPEIDWRPDQLMPEDYFAF